MPVLSEPEPSYGLAILPPTPVTSVFLAAVLLVLLGIHLSRRRRTMSMGMSMGMSMSMEPKAPSSPSPSEKVPRTSSQTNNTSPRPDPPPSASPEEPKRSPQAPPQSAPFCPPLPAPTDPDFSSFEPVEPALALPPRRRSYTKTMVDGTEVSGEILVAEAWRRHTRVFGGGVCQACEESERMST